MYININITQYESNTRLFLFFYVALYLWSFFVSSQKRDSIKKLYFLKIITAINDFFNSVSCTFAGCLLLLLIILISFLFLLFNQV